MKHVSSLTFVRIREIVFCAIIAFSSGCTSKKSEALMAFHEARSLAELLGSKSSLVDHDIGKTVSGFEKHSVCGGWMTLGNEMNLSNKKIIVISRKAIKMDYPKARKDHSERYFGIDSKFNILEISVDRKSAELSMFLGAGNP